MKCAKYAHGERLCATWEITSKSGNFSASNIQRKLKKACTILKIVYFSSVTRLWTIPFLAKRRYLATLYVLVIRSFQSDFEQIVFWIANQMCITCHGNVPLTS